MKDCLPAWYREKQNKEFLKMIRKEDGAMTSESVVTEITIRLFNNRFVWQWTKFTSDKSVVAKILQNTRENLGYSPVSKFDEVKFQNLENSGEWYLDTENLQKRLGLDSTGANDRLKDAFIDACLDIGDEYEIKFKFNVIDVIAGTNEVVDGDY